MAALLLGSGAPSWADGTADLALGSRAVTGVAIGETVTIPLTLYNFGPDSETSRSGMLEVQAPPGTYIVRSSVQPISPPCEFSESDTRMSCRLYPLEQWKGVTAGSSRMGWIDFRATAEIGPDTKGWAEVSCTCDPYAGNNRVDLVLNGGSPRPPRPGPTASPSAKPSVSVQSSASPRPSRAASARASSAAASPTDPSEVQPTESMPEPSSDPITGVDVPTAAPASSGPDLVLLAGIGIVVLALAGLGGAVYVWRRDRTE